MKRFFLTIAILAPLALGAAYALAPSGATAEVPSPTGSMKATVQGLTAAHRLARAKCERLVGAERGNCRTEARAEAKRARRTAPGIDQPG
jgi:hypothetical protein